MTGKLRVNWNRQIQLHAGWAMSLLVLAFGGGTLTLALVAAWAGVRLNDSPSMPTGLYVRTSSESVANLVVRRRRDAADDLAGAAFSMPGVENWCSTAA